MQRVLLSLVLLVSFLTLSNKTYATHAMGGDIWYECNGGNSYTIFFAFYRDCNGVNAPNTVTIDYGSSCTGTSSVTLNQVPGTGQDITPTCPGQQTTCAGGNFPGVEKYVYSATVNLAPCDDWTFSTSVCCRNNAITNINNPGGEEMYLQATLDNLNNPCNSSPVLSNDPVPYVCVGESFCFSHGAIDADGDSISFSQIVPLDQGTTDPVNYTGGFNESQPVSSNPAITFNQTTGEICMTPSNIEVSVTALVVEHWSNGNLVGTTMRDIQIVVINCNNVLPTVDGIDATNDFSTNACAGTPITFTTTGADNNAGNLLTMSWNAGITGATFNIAGNGTTAPIGSFNWTPTLADVSTTPYCFTVTIQDDQCPLNGFQIYSFCITVGAGNVDATASGTDPTCFGVCNGIGTVTGAGGNPPYTYSVDGTNYGGTNTFNGLCANDYGLWVMDQDGCSNYDSIQLVEPPELLLTPSATDVSCNGGADGIVGVAVTGGTPPYTYAWSSGGTNATETGLTVGTYTVTVTDDNGCQELLDVTLVEPTPIVVNVTTTDPGCSGNDGEIVLAASGGTPVYDFDWTHDPGLNSNTATGLGLGTFDADVIDANGCLTSITATLNLAGAAQAGFSYNGNQCLTGNSFQFTNQGTTGVTYQWDFGDGLGTSTQENPVYVYTTSGTFSVEQIVTDGLCADTIVIDAFVYDEPQITNVQTDVSCFGGADASIDITITGGTPNYGTAWSNGSINEDQTGLQAGTYDVIVSDNNGCLANESIIITEPTQLTSTVVITNSLCLNLCTGQAALTPAGGTGPFTYQWDDPLGQIVPTATGLCSGTYTGTITDANGCVLDTLITIGDDNTVLVTTTIVPSSCGQPDGTLTANPVGGVGPYNYLWPSLAQTTQTAINVAAGNYTVQVADDNGCLGYDTIIVADLPAPTATISNVTHILCNGDLTGVAEVTATGGTGIYDYLWSSGGTGTIENGLSAGQYIATVTDDAGCIAQVAVTINEPTAMSGLTGSVNANCGLADGSASIIVTGGVPSTGYDYSWSDGVSVVGTSSTLNASTGMYYITVTDDNGCMLQDSVFINDNPAGTITTLSTDESCFGACDGTGLTVMSGGTAPFQYQWNDPNNTFGPNVVGLCEGTFDVTVTDGLGCVVTDSVVVGTPPKLLVNIVSQIDVTCFGDADGSIEILATGGVTPYSYLWDASAGGQTGVLANGLSAGSYTVVVTDANGCTESVTGSIGEPDEIVATATSINAHCNSPDGTATVAVINGGVQPLTYSWTGSSSTNDIATGLIPGNYTATVSDLNGCQGIADVVVGNTLAGVATITNAIDPTCFSSCNGLAAVSMSGTGVGPFTYSWDDPNNQSTVFASGLCGGVNYTVTVTDVNGCVSTASVSLTDPPALNVALNPADVICFGECTGSMGSNVTGGTPPYSYQWNDAAQQVSNTAVNLCALTQYTLVVTDDQNCTASAVSSVDQPAPIEIDSTVNNSFCGQSIGDACISISGGIPGYDVVWLHNSSTTLCESTLAAGTYLVEVTDANDCPAQTSITISDVSGPTASVTNVTNVSCANNSNGQVTAVVSGGTAPFNYLWDANTGGQTTPTASNLGAGSYTFTVLDSAGCTASGVAVITEPQPLNVSLSFSNPVCNGYTDGTITSTIFGGTAPYTYTWSHNPGLTAANATGLSAGFYSLSVIDANGCSSTEVVTLIDPQPLSVGMTGSDLGCNSICNGTAIATPLNGTGPYTYQWDDPNQQTTQIANGLCANTYQAIVNDVNGCIDTAFVVISEPDSLLSSISLAGDVTCNGACDGYAEVSGAGGTYPYSYLWSNGDTTQLIDGLCPGNYGVIIADANGCTASALQSIVQPTALSGTMITTDVTCYNACNGSAQFVVSGGTGAYTYQWDDASFQTTPNAVGLCAGNYTVNVFDDNNCALVGSTQIVEPTQVVINSNITNSNCGQSNGMACVAVSGGTGPYIYQWNDPNSQSTACALNVPAGSYQVAVTDDNNCVTYQQVDITDLLGPNVTYVTSSNISCSGLSDGSIEMSYGGGTLPYQSVQWLDVLGNVVGNPNDPVLSNVSEGCYTFEVTDDVGCRAALTHCISEPDPLNLTFINIEDVSCSGLCDGEAEVVYSGGIAPHSILWGNGNTSSEIAGLCVGSESVVITDDNGCTTNGSVTINQPSPLTTVQVGTSMTSCSNTCDGTIQVQSLGGMAPYFYSWSPNTGNSSLATQLCAGNYTVQTTDANGCQLLTNYAVTSPSPLLGTIASTIATCGLCNATSSLSGSGGTAPYAYVWQDAQTSQVATNVCQGAYEGTIIDDNGCQLTLSTNITNVDGPTINSIVTTDLLCNGDVSGEATVNYSGGTAPFTISWNQTSQTTQTITSLPAGNYCAQIVDGNGCIAYDCEEVLEPEVLFGVADLNTTICFGDTAQLWASSVGGTGPYTYQWQAPHDTLSGVGPFSISPVATTDYCFTVSDANGCVGANMACATYTVTPPLSIDALDSVGICLGDSITITSIASGGNGDPYQFEWYYNNPDSTSIDNLQDLSNYEGGIGWYYVTLNDGCSREAMDSTLVELEPYPTASIWSEDTVVCFPDEVSFMVDSDIGVQFDWDFDSDGQIDYSGTDSIVTFEYSSSGIYNVTVSVQSDFGCTTTMTDTALIGVYNPPTADFEATPFIVSYLEPTVSVIDLSSEVIGWEWDFETDGTVDELTQNASYTYSDLGQYLITLTVTDTNGCIDSAAYPIEVREEYAIYVPNTFTPDDDGKNDVFNIVVSGYDENRAELWIFDRWGLLVSFTRGTDGWDGTYNGGECQQDAYVWMVKIPNEHGLIQTFRGHVNLLR